MARILERDGGCCVWCSRPLALGDRLLTFEHVIPRLKGGPAWAENEVAACRACNRARGHTAPSLWLEACEARGLKARRAVVERALLALRDAIAERGGQRRERVRPAGLGGDLGEHVHARARVRGHATVNEEAHGPGKSAEGVMAVLGSLPKPEHGAVPLRGGVISAV